VSLRPPRLDAAAPGDERFQLSPVLASRRCGKARRPSAGWRKPSAWSGLPSHQRRLLCTLGLVEGRRQGRSIGYALDDDHVTELVVQALDHTNQRCCSRLPGTVDFRESRMDDHAAGNLVPWQRVYRSARSATVASEPRCTVSALRRSRTRRVSERPTDE
jgi:hypothetical protein